MNVLCFGSSNTYGYDPRSFLGDRLPADARWVDLLGKKSGWTMLNAGVNGREIPRREEEFDMVARLISRSQPLHRMLIMTGLNDLLQGADVPTVISRLEAFLTGLPLPKEQLVLIAPPPMTEGTWTVNTDLPGRSLRFTGACRNLAEKLDIPFVDTVDWDIECMFDGVHFTEDGSRRFADRLWAALQTLSD